MLPTIALWPSALTPPSASGASSHSRQGGWQAGRQGCSQAAHPEPLRAMQTMRGKANSLIASSCIARCCALADKLFVSHPLGWRVPRPAAARRPFLTSDEAVAMFMCTLQNNWPRLGAQLALPGQLHLTALHTYFTLFSVFSVFARCCFQCCFSVGKLPKSISRAYVLSHSA